MDSESSTLPQACSGECSSCSVVPAQDGADAEPTPFQGWSMAGASVFFFLVPLLIAACAAVMLRRLGPGAQWAAGVGGLLFGMALTSLIARRIGRR